MTLAKDTRVENHKLAFGLLIQALGDGALDTTIFDSSQPPLDGQILRTTWEEMERAGYVEKFGPTQYRLTAKGWLVGLEVTGASQSAEYLERLGRLLAVMKGHVKGRKDSVVVPLRNLAAESSEAEGWIFNIIDSRSSSTGGRTGANWREGARGRIVEIPVDFNLEPVDIVYALTVQHLEKIEQLEARLAEAEEDRAQFHCPYCDAPFLGASDQDFPEYHCTVTYESFACGYTTADGGEDAPCPYGPNWPPADEFEFITKQSGEMYVCVPIGKTPRAKRVHVYTEMQRTREEAEEQARKAVAPKKK
jgi:hypothetical protein